MLKIEKPALIMFVIGLVLVLIFPFAVYRDWVTYNDRLPLLLHQLNVTGMEDLKGTFTGMVIIRALVLLLPSFLLVFCAGILTWKENRKSDKQDRVPFRLSPDLSGESLIHLHRISKKYSNSSGKEQVVLNQLELDVYFGQWIAICGASGSGKTSLANIIAGIDDRYEGDYRLNGTNIHWWSEDQKAYLRAKNLCYITQDFNLIPYLTVLENTGISSFALKEKLDVQRAAGILKVLGLEGKEASFPSELSGGEKQRTAIGRALYGKSAVLLADEPTGSLDPVSRDLFLDMVQDLHEQTDSCIIMITHDPQTAARADLIYDLVDGKLVVRK